MTTEEFEFFADPMCEGRITPRALMAPTGTISMPLLRELLRKKSFGKVTRLAGAGWFFNVGYRDGWFIVQRNGAQVAIDEEWCAVNEPPDGVLVSWTLEMLMLSFGDHLTHHKHPQVVKWTKAVGPPPQLVRWVRGQELSQVATFSSEEEFLIRAHSSLQRFDERFKKILVGDVFWDVRRRGNNVVARTPKREIEVQSAIHAMLVDQLELSNIDVYPEVRSPAGSVDFLMTGNISGRETGKLCLEFKNAHSPALVCGIATQLRGYMERLEVSNGAYCVLDYRNAFFAKPATSTSELLAKLYKEDLSFATWPNRPIKVHWLEVGKVGMQS